MLLEFYNYLDLISADSNLLEKTIFINGMCILNSFTKLNSESILKIHLMGIFDCFYIARNRNPARLYFEKLYYINCRLSSLCFCV